MLILIIFFFRNNNRQSGYNRSYGRGSGPDSSYNTSGFGSSLGSCPSFDEMKSEGRRKLLEEVAGLLNPSNSDSSATENKTTYQTGTSSQICKGNFFKMFIKFRSNNFIINVYLDLL